MCCYLDELNPIMGSPTCANPPVMSESTNFSIPKLLSITNNSHPPDQQATGLEPFGQTEGLCCHRQSDQWLQEKRTVQMCIIGFDFTIQLHDI
ncbi:hypothetical protein VP01_5775g2 [Puccinia sorghi]|uniref:Uncharacterized protein n=1 Tax=Puccinia sorghi TaxID=27349 RepID=A0A0L6UIC1_9BASI|nr:hypothetical protein VP01_5775g2 [Puccinia sorghi]